MGWLTVDFEFPEEWTDEEVAQLVDELMIEGEYRGCKSAGVIYGGPRNHTDG